MMDGEVTVNLLIVTPDVVSEENREDEYNYFVMVSLVCTE